ncbi:MAG: hypothetical protein HGA75_09285 [Thiobacillus sp.]|nr:hypothetical protein [Thiobacillus sp.]
MNGAVSTYASKDRLRPQALVLARLALVVGLLPSLAGCLVIPEDKTYQALVEEEKSSRQVYKLYPGSVRPANELAILLINDVASATVDGFGVSKTDYQEVHVLPGRHALAWRQQFGFSVMVEPALLKEASLAVAVDLQAGHVYKLFADRTYGTGYRFYFWLEDAASRAVVGGTKKP